MTSEADDRRARAVELRLAGATYDAIAKAVGYASRSGAHKAVQEALADPSQDGPSEATETDLARLDAMLTGLWPKARRGDVQAVDRVLRIIERRTSLLLIASKDETHEEVSLVDELAARRGAGAQAAGAPSRRRRSG